MEDHKNDNVSDITNFFKNVDTTDGAKILQHILGSKNENVQKYQGGSDVVNLIGNVLGGFFKK